MVRHYLEGLGIRLPQVEERARCAYRDLVKAKLTGVERALVHDVLEFIGDDVLEFIGDGARASRGQIVCTIVKRTSHSPHTSWRRWGLALEPPEARAGRVRARLPLGPGK